MKLTFFGTGTSQGIPIIGCKCPVCRSTDPRDKRYRASALFEVDGLNILIDCGPDFRSQMLRLGCAMTEQIHADQIRITAKGFKARHLAGCAHKQHSSAGLQKLFKRQTRFTGKLRMHVAGTAERLHIAFRPRNLRLHIIPPAGTEIHTAFGEHGLSQQGCDPARS